MLKIYFDFILIIWQFPQYIIGFIFGLFIKVNKKIIYKRSIVYLININISVSFGKQIYIWYHMEKNEIDKLIKHEYGHSIQSIILGPLYIVFSFIPSMLRHSIFFIKYVTAKNKNDKTLVWKKYYMGYPENWADKLDGINNNDM